MKLFVGTSGWTYEWNPDGLEWYVSESGFNAVELNMSFYSFPRPSTVEKWSREGRRLRWAVKVHRSITHVRRLNEKALPTWEKFRGAFSELEDSIDFYLFQLPPSMALTGEAKSRLRAFARTCDRIAVEPRHPSWFTSESIGFFHENSIVFVVPDSPLFEGLPPTGVVAVNDTVYVRMHGRLAWYNYGYLDEELEEVARGIVARSPGRAYVFFNNDHDMLGDGRRLIEMFREKYGVVTA